MSTYIATPVEELYAEIARLRAENDMLREAAAKLARVDERWENEVALRIRLQMRLYWVAVVLHEVEQAYPHTGPVIEQARKDIWPHEE